jgi:UDP-N-acetyl-D-mannosaminuronic acid dehydrogenase
VGLGYIGLPTAATLASRGVDVVGVDINPEVIEAVNNSRPIFSEPDLDMLLRAATTLGKLRAAPQPEPADAFIIAVPTPFHEDRSANLDHVDSATHAIAPALRSGNIVVLESTAPVGTTAHLATRLARLRPDLRFPPGRRSEPLDVHVAHCPERVMPGRMVRELIENDRIIGGLTEACTEHPEAIYEIFLQGKMFRTDASTAELVKLAENAFRDVNIAFANELSLVCGRLGLDVWNVIELANRHPRVSIPRPGAGVGGHCIAVDPWFIVASAPEETRLIRAAREVNDSKPRFVVAQIRERAQRFK